MTKPSLALVVCLLALEGCTTPAAEPQKVDPEAKSAADGGEDERARHRRRGKQVPAPDDVAAPPADAQKTASGITYKVITPGEGASPSENDSVKVHLTSWRDDGTTYETTQGRKTPKMIRLNRPPVPGLTEAIQLMKLGETTRFWIPQELTYKGRRGAPEGTLCYEITLEEILAAPPVPADVAAPPEDAVRTESGLAYKVLQPGTGDTKPDEWDRVRVNYTGWHTDGKMFDSSITRGRPATFPVNRVVPGWTEGLQLMVVGEKTRFWVPEELAYKGQPGKPPGMLVFDVELLHIDEQPQPPPPPEVPPDVAAPPDDAQKTASGLAYKVLGKGTGTVHPTPTDQVTVHYSGWTTDGKMFDSSVARNRPSSFGVSRVIAGWTEGLQLMVVGDKMRFWIPVDLAYKNAPGKPAGMLVFDVELLGINEPRQGPHGRPMPGMPPGHGAATMPRPPNGSLGTKSPDGPAPQ